MELINLTPETVRLNDGQEFPPSGKVVKLTKEFQTMDLDGIDEIGLHGYKVFKKTETIVDLPSEVDNETLIVSADVFAATKKYQPFRGDIITPAASHPSCIYKDGKLWSVPGFLW
jgi:hypothetical protein